MGREKRRPAGRGGATGAPKGRRASKEKGQPNEGGESHGYGREKREELADFFFILVGSFYRFVIGSLYFAIILTSDVKTLYRNFTNYNNKLLLLLYFYKPLAEFFGYTNLIIV